MSFFGVKHFLIFSPQTREAPHTHMILGSQRALFFFQAKQLRGPEKSLNAFLDFAWDALVMLSFTASLTIAVHNFFRWRSFEPLQLHLTGLWRHDPFALEYGRKFRGQNKASKGLIKGKMLQKMYKPQNRCFEQGVVWSNPKEGWRFSTMLEIVHQQLTIINLLSQFEHVDRATPFARRLDEDISESNAYGTGPQEAPKLSI